ncbi:MAG: carboxypeptidase regulatory-like domain-containing protein [Armatimonadota bacterium]
MFLAGFGLVLLMTGLSVAQAAEPPWIFACHDLGGYSKIEQAGKQGWLVVTVAIGHDPSNHSGDDFSFYANRGHGVIVRLNNGYGSDGTLPYQSQYQNFATRCANYVAATTGADIFIIGNETNLPREWPGNVNGDPNTGEAITVARYVDCYNRCYDAIKAVRPNAQIVPAPSGTWAPPYDGVYGPNRGIEGFLDYWVNILNAIGPSRIDALAIHVYTHGCDPALVTDPSKMGPPYQNIYYNFQVYRNYMSAIPVSMRSKPVYITECDQNIECADPPPSPRHTWLNANNGWVKAVYSEINSWNQNPSNQKIRCLALFRWDDVSEGEWAFGFSNRNGVIADWIEAMANDYRWTSVLGSISGSVKDLWGNPVQNATVYISPGNYVTKTNSSGAFSISVQPGTYTLVASKLGYCPQTISGKTVTSGQNVTADFTLVNSTNLVTNGDFEGGFTSGIGNSWLTWTGYWSNSVMWVDSTDIFYNGLHAQRWGRSDAKPVHGGLCRSVPVSPGKLYSLSAHLRFTSTDPDAWIELGYDLTGQVADGEAATINYTKYESGGQNKWLFALKNFTATGTAVSVFTKFGHVNQVGSGPCWAWVDDVNLVEVVGAIVGYVNDGDGTPLQGVVITTTPGGYSAVSNENGYYVLSGLPANTYSLTASKPGYMPKTLGSVLVKGGQVTRSDFTLYALIAVGSISEAKLLPDGTWVEVSNVVCSRRPSSTLMFAQEADRSSGIRVTAGTGSIPAIGPGTKCTVRGRLSTLSDTRRITDVAVSVVGSVGTVAPLAMKCTNVGGVDFFYNPGPPVSGQKGVSGSLGPNNVGLLVKIWGRVLDTPVGGIIHVDDGSVPPGGIPVRLMSGVTAPAKGSYVSVVGIPEPGGFVVVQTSDIRVY